MVTNIEVDILLGSAIRYLQCQIRINGFLAGKINRQKLNINY